MWILWSEPSYGVLEGNADNTKQSHSHQTTGQNETKTHLYQNKADVLYKMLSCIWALLTIRSQRVQCTRHWTEYACENMFTNSHH